MKLRLTLALAVLLLLNAGGASAAPIQVFETDFDGALAPEISPGTATLTGVQGYAGLGPAGNQFGGNFLRSATGNTVTLSLAGLPAHDTITLEFLFAAIDSLDGPARFRPAISSKSSSTARRCSASRLRTRSRLRFKVTSHPQA